MSTSTRPQDLLESFLLDAWDALGTFQRATRELRVAAKGGGLEPAALRRLQVVSHRLKGSAALYGFPETSRVAELVERLAGHAPALAAAEHDTLLTFLEQAEACMVEAIDRITVSGREGELGLALNRLGGAALVTRLLQARPEAFVRPEAAPEAAGQAAEQVGLEAGLRAWRGRQAEAWSYFEPEARDHLERISDALHAPPHERLEALFRAFHTLKGAADMVGAPGVGPLAHRFEDLLSEVRDGTRTFDDELGGLIEEGAGLIGAMLDAAAGRPSGAAARAELVNARLDEMGAGRADDPAATPPPIVLPSGPAPLSEPAAPTTPHEGAQALRALRSEDEELWSYFRPEIEELLGRFDASLERLEIEPDPDAALELYRAAHTVKGSALMVGAEALGAVGRILQDLLAPVRDEGALPDADVLRRAANGRALLAALLEAAEAPDEAAARRADDAVRRAEGVFAGAAGTPAPTEDPLVGPALPAPEASTASAGADAPAPTSTGRGAPVADAPVVDDPVIRVRLSRLDALLELTGDLATRRARLQRLLTDFEEIGRSLALSRTRMGRSVEEFQERYLNPTLQVERDDDDDGDALRGGATVREMFDELELDSYDDLNILARSVGEMSADLEQLQEQFTELRRRLGEESGAIERLGRTLRSEIGQARMVPVGTLFDRLRRVAPEAGSGVRARLELRGEAVEIDNLILEGLAEPLLHLVRNAFAHGLEPAPERLRLGKPAEGRVTLRASARGNRVLIEVEDDGRGIDVEGVKARAVESGLRSAEEVAGLTRDEALALVFLPGLSTAERVTSVAGRGVGMDAVEAAARRLGGEVAIDSAPGRGTRFSLRLPLTVIVTDVLAVSQGGSTLALPLDAVRAVLARESAPLRGEGEERRLLFEGEILPILDFAAALELPASDASELVVVASEGGSYALAVGGLAGIHEVVVKGLTPALQRLPYLAGTTVTSEGAVLPILDPTGLRGLAQSVSSASDVATSAAPAPRRAAAARVLLVDDSISVRKVVGRMLERAGYGVTTAVDGQAALDLFYAGRSFDAVVTDLEMPRLNGFELIEQLRRRPDAVHLPLAVVTTRAGEKHGSLARQLGANAYLPKPVDEAELLGFLAQALAPQSPKPQGVRP